MSLTNIARLPPMDGLGIYTSALKKSPRTWDGCGWHGTLRHEQWVIWLMEQPMAYNSNKYHGRLEVAGYDFLLYLQGFPAMWFT